MPLGCLKMRYVVRAADVPRHTAEYHRGPSKYLICKPP